MNGVLVADKPVNWTSHDVVGYLKKKLGAKKAGHLGTLDPLATGVLLVVLDEATKYARFLEGGAKEYLAKIKLGEETDTLDAEGEVVKRGDVPELTSQDIDKALIKFSGKIKQVPPMYSSVKKGGQPLYKLARKGKTVERQAREIEVFSIEVTAIDLPCIEIRVSCSRGTYIRSIAADLGEALGCGAHLAGLRRTGSGVFDIKEAADIELPKDELVKRIIPLESALLRASKDLPAIELEKNEAESLFSGARTLQMREGFFAFIGASEVVRFDHDGKVKALAAHDKEKGRLKVKKVFDDGPLITRKTVA